MSIEHTAVGDEDRRTHHGERDVFETAVGEHDAKQNEQELRRVGRLVRQRDPDRILEIGTHEGGSLYAWAEWLNPELLVSVDESHTEQRCERIRSIGGVGTEVVPIRGRSQNDAVVERVLSYFEDGIDFLFIDGGSTYREVKADYENYAPTVTGGGVIAFHDIVTHRSDEQYPEPVQVNEVWEEVKQDYDDDQITEIVEAGDEYGYGIVFVEGSATASAPIDSANLL